MAEQTSHDFMRRALAVHEISRAALIEQMVRDYPGRMTREKIDESVDQFLAGKACAYGVAESICRIVARKLGITPQRAVDKILPAKGSES